MSDSPIRFDDGAAYERMMGVWSRLVGEEFLAWLAPEPGLRWIDVGCGNGAFTELIAERCAPADILGVDPSEGQLAFARSRHTRGVARFEQGGAMELPAADGAFDSAVMALVLFFVPDPARGVAEMKRVVRPGGLISAYVWDLLEPEGFPMAGLQEELRALGRTPMLPPSAEVSRMAALKGVWEAAGLTDIAAREITVERRFADFEDFWSSVEIALGMIRGPNELSAEEKDGVKARLRERYPADPSGAVRFTARANAIKGRAPV